MTDALEQISGLLREAGETHHRVFRIVDGADGDWASWYAQWLIDLSELPDLLGARPVRSELVYLQSQQTTSRLSQFIRSCRRARAGSSDRRCSMSRSRPPGRRTLRSSRRARGWSSTPHRTRVETATSKLWSSNGRSSAGASDAS